MIKNAKIRNDNQMGATTVKNVLNGSLHVLNGTLRRAQGPLSSVTRIQNHNEKKDTERRRKGKESHKKNQVFTEIMILRSCKEISYTQAANKLNRMSEMKEAVSNY